MSGKLILAGTGIGGLKRMTMEVHDHLHSAMRIFHLTSLHDHLSRNYTADIVDLASVYHTAKSKTEAYSTITKTLLDAVMNGQDQDNIVFLTYGHPLFLVNSSLDLMACVDCTILPALSAFDTLLIDSPVSLSNGAQLFETTKFVALRQRPAAFDPVVLFQFGDYASQDTKGTPNIARLKLLKQHLLRDFPASHKLYVVVSSWDDGISRQIVSLRLENLDERHDAVIPGATMIMPPVREV
ncbi:MAG: hypothetical protein GQ535_03750 [Rhodobacteraceae bacterium]|nr:hypothetical protein [Paracoccaceae bacterium]